MKKTFVFFLCALLALLPLQGLSAELLDIYDPSVFAAHPLLQSREMGCCKALIGNVEVILVFVDTPERAWDADSQLQTFETILDGLNHLEEDALQYGVSLRFSTKAYRSALNLLPTLSSDDGWIHDAAANAEGMPPLTAPGSGEASVFCQNAQPILFLFQGGGRCFAIPGGADYQEECLVLYAENLHTGTVCHELLHLYGAQDYYTPSGYKEAARTVFPNSLMLESSPENSVDSLTAYLIGWCTQPDAQAVKFLAATKDISGETIAQEQESNQFSGYGEKRFDGYLYTGDLVNGIPHGEGTILWDDGNRFEGHFSHGLSNGNGTFTWNDGNSYTGDYVAGEMSGYGALQWNDGTRYEGQFQSGNPSGLGTYTWTNGVKYYGVFSGGDPTGLGVMKWPGADDLPDEIYFGQFQGFSRIGFGTCLWSDGSIYSGEFSGGIRNGLGAMWWKASDGSLGDAYLGDFQDGVRNGRGTLRWENGDVYTGDFSEGIPTGKGTYVWADGSVLTGEFLNGCCNGYGVYVDTNGNVTTGYWVGGEYMGTEKTQ